MRLPLLALAVAALAVGYATAGHAAATRAVPKCPAHAPEVVSLDVAGRFVRPGATAVRLCRYYGDNWGFPYGLRRQRLLRSSLTIGRITHTFNRLKEPPRGIFCMKDDGSKMLVVFAYPHARPERVTVKLTGCRFATNGQGIRWSTPHLQHRLVHLVETS
jgi:hypothetical protein